MVLKNPRTDVETTKENNVISPARQRADQGDWGLPLNKQRRHSVQDVTACEFEKSSDGGVGLWYLSDAGGLFFICII